MIYCIGSVRAVQCPLSNFSKVVSGRQSIKFNSAAFQNHTVFVPLAIENVTSIVLDCQSVWENVGLRSLQPREHWRIFFRRSANYGISGVPLMSQCFVTILCPGALIMSSVGSIIVCLFSLLTQDDILCLDVDVTCALCILQVHVSNIARRILLALRS